MSSRSCCPLLERFLQAGEHCQLHSALHLHWSCDEVLAAVQAIARGENVSKEFLGTEAGKEVPLVRQQDLDNFVAQVTINQQQLQAKTLEHLVAKLLVSPGQCN
jgi:hypothetical protein